MTGTPAAAQASTSSKPRPKTKLSPPLKRTTRLPARARSTMTSLMSSCDAERPRGQLGDVDQLDVRAELVEQLARGEPVGDDDVGRGERVAGGDGDEARARPGRRRPARRPGVRSWASAAVRWPSRRAVTMSSRSAADLRGSRLPSTPTVTLPWWPDGRASTPMPPRASSARTQKVCRRLGGRGDARVDLRVVGRGDDVPRTVEVGLGEVAQVRA